MEGQAKVENLVACFWRERYTEETKVETNACFRLKELNKACIEVQAVILYVMRWFPNGFFQAEGPFLVLWIKQNKSM